MNKSQGIEVNASIILYSTTAPHSTVKDIQMEFRIFSKLCFFLPACKSWIRRE